MGHAPTVTASYRYQDNETTGTTFQDSDSDFVCAKFEQTNETWQIRFDLPLSAGRDRCKPTARRRAIQCSMERAST